MSTPGTLPSAATPPPPPAQALCSPLLPPASGPSLPVPSVVPDGTSPVLPGPRTVSRSSVSEEERDRSRSRPSLVRFFAPLLPLSLPRGLASASPSARRRRCTSPPTPVVWDMKNNPRPWEHVVRPSLTLLLPSAPARGAARSQHESEEPLARRSDPTTRSLPVCVSPTDHPSLSSTCSHALMPSVRPFARRRTSRSSSTPCVPFALTSLVRARVPTTRPDDLGPAALARPSRSTTSTPESRPSTCPFSSSPPPPALLLTFPSFVKHSWKRDRL